jgi:transposase
MITGGGKVRPSPQSIMKRVPLIVPAPRAVAISLTAGERKVLNKRACGHKTPHRDRVRALIVVLAARGYSNEKVASTAGVHPDTARRWRGRFAEQGLAGLTDRPRSGRPTRFTPLQSAAVKALACQLPAQTGVPLSRWSVPELARHAVNAGVAESMSRPRSAAGWPPTSSSPGSTGPGSSSLIRTSAPKPSACWICMPADGKVSP